MRTLFVLVALAAVVLSFLLMPRRRDVWESQSHAVRNGGIRHRFAIEVKQNGLSLFAVPTQVGQSIDIADRLLFWWDGSSIRHVYLVRDGQLMDQPVRLDGEWPLNLCLVTFGAYSIFEEMSMDAKGRLRPVVTMTLYARDDRRMQGAVEDWGRDYLLDRARFQARGK
jgi:hypothetical protein